MTTYTLQGFAVERDNNDNVTNVFAVALDAVFIDGLDSINYSIISALPNELPLVDLGTDNTVLNARVFGSGFPADGLEIAGNTDDSLGQVTTAQGTSIILSIEPFAAPNTELLFLIGGVPLTLPTTPAEFNALEASVTAIGQVTSGPFAPGVNIPMTSLLNTTSSENDSIVGGSGDDSLPGGAGNDTINGNDGNDTLLGGDGNDNMLGGTGNDLINPGDNIGGNTGFDLIQTGTGNDTVDFVDILTGWVALNYSPVAGPIIATINGVTNTGTVNKGGGSGTDTLLNVVNPLNSGWTTGGLRVTGSAGDDTFNITIGDEQWMDVVGRSGSDMINITNSGNGLVRLSYNSSTGNVVADLGAGTVMQNGATDTITGQAWEIRAGDGSDSLLGSANDESFIGQGGNDTINGAGGFDRLRFDRSGNDSAVNVNLETGMATGTFNGAGFTYDISNIEWVRGTGTFDNSGELVGFNDTLTGANGVDNLLEGREGDDSLTGLSGDDTLAGDKGADTLDGGDGKDTADYRNATEKVRIDMLDVTKNQGEAVGDIYISIEALMGSAFNDTFLSTNGRDRQEGLGGDDNLRGRGGRDTILGGEGEDTVNGGKGRDRVEGGADDDLLLGITGLDNLLGGKGNDTLEGGAHNDRLTGGKGNDTFVFNDNEGNDVVTDFNALNANEKIDVSGVTALASMADVTAAASQQGADVLIDTGGGNSILLEGVNLADLDASDFIF